MDTHEAVLLKLFVLGILDMKETTMAKTKERSNVPRNKIVDLQQAGKTKSATVNAWTMSRVSGAETQEAPRLRRVCNESRLQWEVEVCGEHFKKDMSLIHPQHWCNLTHFISEYHLFTLCTESKSHSVDCYWPNPLVEGYIIRIHKAFFSNCSDEQVVWVDPPDETLITLILIPIFLTLAMITLVVWCSKRSDILA